MNNGHGGGAAHRHRHDRGVGAFFRYLSLLPELWRSEVGPAVVRSLAPRTGERVVDLGAGMGSASAAAAESGAEVTAVDPGWYMRGALRLRGFLGRGPAAVLDGAAESIPLEDASVDALWTVNTIHHWTDRPAACRELARVMRRGGRVLLVDEDFMDPAHPGHARHQAKARRFHFDDVDPVVLAAQLREAGFARAEGMKTSFAGRPAKAVQAVR